MKVWNRGDVPGAASHRTRLESVEIVGDVDDDHFDDVIWKTAGRFMYKACVWRPITEQAIDVGFASTPNDPHASREVYSYGANGAEVRTVYVYHWVTIPVTEDIDALDRTTFPVVGDFVIVVGVK